MNTGARQGDSFGSASSGVASCGAITQKWFGFDYRFQPSGFQTFSLPAVYTCARPGPFTAVAVVDRGVYTARRGGLHLRQITC